MDPHEMDRRSGCPEIETLAAFVDGRLESAELSAVVEHLADCDACRELVAECRALVGELGPAGVEAPAGVQPLRRFAPRWVWGLAAVLAVASVGLGYFLMAKAPAVDAVLADFGRRGEAARLPADWTDARWPVMRGEHSAVTERALAFRLGVRWADLALALGLGDRPKVESLATECAATLAEVPFSDSIAQRYREIAAMAADRSSDLRTVDGVAALAARETREAVDEAALDLGAWAEAERLMASARSPRVALRPPSSSAVPPALADLVAAAVESTRQADFAAREAAFARLIARAGDPG